MQPNNNPQKPSRLARIFNFLSEVPKRSWTVGGFVFGEASKSEFDFNLLKGWAMPRAGRVVERAATLSGIFASVAYAATFAAPMVAIPVAIGLAAVSKAAGMLIGGVTNSVVKKLDRKYNV